LFLDFQTLVRFQKSCQARRVTPVTAGPNSAKPT
jgi:hypothetical protein